MLGETTIRVSPYLGIKRWEFVTIGAGRRFVLEVDRFTITIGDYRWYHRPLRWWRRFWDWIS